MNSRQLEVELIKLKNEEKTRKRLTKIYKEAEKDILDKITIKDKTISNLLMKGRLDDFERSILKSQVYQKEFQMNLLNQLRQHMRDLSPTQTKIVDEYLEECFEVSYLGAMYDINGQKVPMTIPINKDEMYSVLLIDNDTYRKLYETYTDETCEKIKDEIVKGIAMGSTTEDVALAVNRKMGIGLSNALRIARTEGHRVQCMASFNAQQKAKETGADIYKQWDSTLDGRTRDSHRAVDGEIRELEKPFSNGLMFPGDPKAPPHEVVNCRCALLQRAKWGLDEKELEVQKERAEYFGLDKTENFEEFRRKFLNIRG